MIRLSIVIPSNRDNLIALARIHQACSWAGPETEVIIRDNSGSASKARQLAHINEENCHIIVSEPCGAHENWLGAFDRSAGEFVYFLSDDDLCLDRAIADIPKKIEEVANDASVVGITGTTVVDGTRGSSLFGYSKLDADNALNRLSGYLGVTGPNVILFSPVRRDVMKWSMEIFRAKPVKLSFDDQLGSLLYLLRGKFVSLNRILFVYDPHHWETSATAQREDMKYYTAASLDPAINKLHWFLCAFEGAILIRNLELDPDYPLARRQAMADYWFATMYNRFKQGRRDDYGSPLAAEAEKLCEKWRMTVGQLSFESILADICQFLALSSRELSLAYFSYWSGYLKLRQVPAA